MLQHFLRPLALLIDLGVEWLRRVDAGVKRLYLQIVARASPAPRRCIPSYGWSPGCPDGPAWPYVWRGFAVSGAWCPREPVLALVCRRSLGPRPAQGGSPTSTGTSSSPGRCVLPYGTLAAGQSDSRYTSLLPWAKPKYPNPKPLTQTLRAAGACLQSLRDLSDATAL